MTSLKTMRMKEFFDALRVRQANSGGALTSSSASGPSDPSTFVETGDSMQNYTPQLLCLSTLFVIAATFLFVTVGAAVDHELGPDKNARPGADMQERTIDTLKLTLQIVFNIVFLLALFYLPPIVIREFRLLARTQQRFLYIVLFGLWVVSLSAQPRLSLSFRRAMAPFGMTDGDE